MAEAFLRAYAGDRFEAYSAGLEPKGIHPLTKKVMDETGIDISRQQSKNLMEYMGKLHFGYLFTVCSDADSNCPATFLGYGQRLHWNIEDPAAFDGTEEQKLHKFRQVRDQIKQTVQSWADNIEPAQDKT
jgi:arsenate reductase